MPNYTIAFTSLTDGDDLDCEKIIRVAWEKPNAADEAEITLDCNCHTDHSGNPDASYPTPNDRTSDTYDFTLVHNLHTDETGRTVVATITHGGAEQNRDTRTDLYAQCPVKAHGAEVAKKKRRSSAGNAITIDEPDNKIVHLYRGKNKRLKGRFVSSFGKRIFVFVHQIKSGRPVLVLVKEVDTKLITKKWKVTLPKILWKKAGVILNIRLAFVSNKGFVGNGYTFPTEIHT
jgi:hypothetical protein